MSRFSVLSSLFVLLVVVLLAPASGQGDTLNGGVTSQPCAITLPESSDAPITPDELRSFMKDAPRFLRWANAQGLAFLVFPAPADLMSDTCAVKTQAVLQDLGWPPQRFLFLLCVTGSAAAAQQTACARDLETQEVTLLRDNMLELMTLYGTGP